MVNKVAFLKVVVDDILLNGNKRTWAEYSEMFNTSKDVLSKSFSRFKNTYAKNGEWHPGNFIEPDYKTKVTEALYKITGDEVDTSGFRVSKMYEQQTKDGEIVLLKSYERDKDKETEDQIDEWLERFKLIAVKQIQNPIIIPQKLSSDNAKSLAVFTADHHIGMKVEKPLFGNDYNEKIYRDRAKEWLFAIKEAYEAYGTLSNLHIVLLGDVLDNYQGYTARGTHLMPTNLRTSEQFELFLQVHIDLFGHILGEKWAENIHFHFITDDNHGGTELGYIASRALEIYLNLKYPQIKTNVVKDFIGHFNIGKHKYIISHGKDDKFMKHGWPMKVTPQVTKFVSSYIKYNGLTSDIRFNEECLYVSVVSGDLHQYSSEMSTEGGFRYLKVPAISATSDYSEYNYAQGKGYSGFVTEVVSDNSPNRSTNLHWY